ncbi:MAG: fasciclin domain-containing protein [Rubripirellula sp.]
MKRTALFASLAVLSLILMKPSFAQDSNTKTIPETALAAGNFETLVAAVKAAGLLDTLAGEGPFTVLAPTDEAFAKLPEGTVESLLKPENKEKLIAVLKLHVAAGKLTSEMAEPGGNFPTLAGSPLKVDVQGEKITVGSAEVLKADIDCSNGVIHVIDTVLLPSTSVDPEKLVGTWTYAKSVANGTTKTAEQLEGQSVTVTPKTWTLNGEAEFVMDYEIDDAVTPNTVKFTITKSPFGAGMSASGLIKMDGEHVVVCYSARGGDAPTDFASEANSGMNLFHLKKSE